MADAYMGASMKHQICLFWTQELIFFLFLCTHSITYPMFSLMRIYYDQKNCCTYDFYTDQEKITFFRWIWPHWFSHWPQNDTDLTLNLSLRSNCFWNTDAYKNLSLYNSNEGSFAAVCCICHILEQILLPPPHNSYLLQISNVFIFKQLQACVQT